MIELIGRVVEVGTGETTYSGKLVEVNENEVYLESDMTGWMVIPTDKVAYIREVAPKED